MPQPVLRIVLTDEERETLNAWSRSTAGEHRMVERSRVILLAAEDLPAREIARRLKTRLARVSKWRRRFCQDRLVGLEDAARPGKPKACDEKTEKRVLTLLDADPPEGYSSGTGAWWPRDWGMSATIRSGVCYGNIKIQFQRRRS